MSDNRCLIFVNTSPLGVTESFDLYNVFKCYCLTTIDYDLRCVLSLSTTGGVVITFVSLRVVCLYLTDCFDQVSPLKLTLVFSMGHHPDGGCLNFFNMESWNLA